MDRELGPAAAASGRRPRLLIVSWLFPPSQVIGSLRVSKFARYLREEGWDVRVLTAASDLLPFAETMPVEVPEDEVVRVRYRDPLSRLERQAVERRASTGGGAPAPAAHRRAGVPDAAFRAVRAVARVGVRVFPINQVRMPDRALFWYRAAERAGRELGTRWRPDAIFSSHGPPGSHVVASRLQRRFGVPWVADYRDLWSGSPTNRYPTVVEAMERRYERSVLRHAEVLTTVSEQLAEVLGSVHRKPVVTLFNGYDEADYAGEVEPAPEFTITYTGWAGPPSRDPAPLFAALRLLRDRGRSPSRMPRVHFVGPNRPEDLLGPAERYGVEDLVRITGRVPLQESIRLQKGSAVLLMLNWTGSSPGGMLSGKLCEYLGTGRPVLAVGPRDPGVSDILDRTRAGRWSDDPEELAEIVEEWMAVHERTGRLEVEADRDQVARFGRRHQARQLSELLSSVLEGAR